MPVARRPSQIAGAHLSAFDAFYLGDKNTSNHGGCPPLCEVGGALGGAAATSWSKLARDLTASKVPTFQSSKDSNDRSIIDGG